MNFIQMVQDFFRFLVAHESATHLLTAIMSLSFALVIFLVLRRFNVSQNDAWAKPFAWAFVVLAALHSLPLLLVLLKQLGITSPYTSYVFYLVAAAGSSLSNYLFFLVGISLGLFRLKAAATKHIKYTALVLLFIAALISTIGDIKIEQLQIVGHWWSWARIPDVLFSTSALLFVGWVLYSNVSSRRAPRMALLAQITLAAAVAYAALFILYGAHPLMAQAGWADWLVTGQPKLSEKIWAMDAAVMSLSLPLKFGYFFPALTLMLMIADPAEGIRRLLKNVTHGEAEFLDNNGVTRSIQEEIKADRVELYIKLPGTERDKVAYYCYSRKNGEVGQPEEIQFDKDTVYGWVMSGPNRVLLFRLINYADSVPDHLRQRLSPRSSVIAVPILFHNAVIGCLKANIGKENGAEDEKSAEKNVAEDEKFAEADLQNIHRFAALLSPISQDHRKGEASKEISHRLTKLQVEARDYDIDRDIGNVAHIAQDILAPLATGISIKAGFRHYEEYFPKDSPYRAMMERQMNSPDSTTVSAGGRKSPDFLLKELKVASGELTGKSDGEHPLGKLVLAAHPTVKRTKLPASALVSKLIYSRDVSNLITDALLNFIRGSLNETTRELNIRMSRLGATKAPAGAEQAVEVERQDNVPTWFETIDEMARKVGFLWTVAKYSNHHEWLGSEIELVKELEGRKNLWQDKGKVEKEGQTHNIYEDYAPNIDIALCTIKQPERETSHVIRISLRESEQVVWLGVGNPVFELEFDYLSPWLGFILRFGDIAHTSLKQNLSKQKQEKFEKEAAEAIGIATVWVMTNTFVHQMVNQVRDLTSPLTMLEDAVKRGRLKGNENHRKIILGMGEAVSQIEGLMKLFSKETKPDDRRPCSLDEAYQYAFDLLRAALARYNINVTTDNLDGQVVDVPFYVAAYALANLLNNARDAIRDGKVKHGLIEVRAEETQTMILCHVTDNGLGVPPDFTTPFESGGKSSKAHGSGLGLYLSAHSLRENRGDIKLTSRGPTPPTTFTLCFPKQRKD